MVGLVHRTDPSRLIEYQSCSLISTMAQFAGPESAVAFAREVIKNILKAPQPPPLVATGRVRRRLCTHQGCPPNLRLGGGGRGEFLCPCHTSRYDLAGRVYREGPALTNLVIPTYRMEGNDRVVIGAG